MGWLRSRKLVNCRLKSLELQLLHVCQSLYIDIELLLTDSPLCDVAVCKSTYISGNQHLTIDEDMQSDHL